MKLLLVLLLSGAAMLPLARAAAQDGSGGALSLQQRIDRAAPEDIVIVDGGVFRESSRHQQIDLADRA